MQTPEKVKTPVTIGTLFKRRRPSSYSPKGVLVACTNPHLLMGVELETENADPDPLYYQQRLNPSLWLVDRDGSLRGGDTAYEFKSAPTKMGHLLPELQAFFATTGFTEQNYSDRCSIHVHTNVTDFTQDNLAVLALVYSVVEDVLFHFINTFHWNKTPEGACRDTNIYCVPWSCCWMHTRLVKKLFQAPQKGLARWVKYTALNFLPITDRGSIEWRHLHGTADMEKITIWLNVIGALMAYAKNNTLEECIQRIKQLNDTSAYQQFFTEVLQGQLPYDQEYQGALFEGVVKAKMSLVDWDGKKEPEGVVVADEEAPVGAVLGGGRHFFLRDGPPPDQLHVGAGQIVRARLQDQWIVADDREPVALRDIEEE